MTNSNFKTRFLCAAIVALFALNKSAIAQDWTQGGNGIVNDDRIGTLTNNPLRFVTGTGGTEWMRIETSGNVGIGITNPAQRLSVDGGNVQIVTGTYSYMIGSDPVLWRNGQTNRLYVGGYSNIIT